MTQEVNILRIIKEDILRIMGEVKRTRISLKSIKEEINASNFYISKAISVLEGENLIKLEKSFVELTEKRAGKGGRYRQKAP
jgi:DNA-binding GntR family transcriptional regulator